MKTFLTALTLALAAALPTGIASAETTFQVFLSGLGVTPPNGSPGTGFGTVILNTAQNQITASESWSGLVAPATASHIHGPAGAGTNAPVLFPFLGVPNATSGAISGQSFAITPTQVGYLFAGYLYMAVHTSVFPGGEIRGQLQLVPNSYTLTLTTNGNGSITADPAFPSYYSDMVVTLTATPQTGCVFIGWSGDATGTGNPLSVTMTTNKTITGRFVFATNSVPVVIGLAAQLAWYADTNFHYQVQAASVLNSNLWFDLGAPTQGNNATNYYYDPFGTNSRRFYRVMTRP